MVQSLKTISAPAMTTLICVFAVPASAATMSLRALKLNGFAITPTNTITVAPGDEIETAIFLFGWEAELPHGVWLYQATIFGAAGFQSGDNGTVLPKGWCAPLLPMACKIDGDCPGQYRECSTAGCRCPTHDPSLGAYINSTRTGDLCYQHPCLCQVNTSTPNYSYLCFGEGAIGIPDIGVPRYLGTLLLVVRDNACGDFTIGFLGNGQSFIVDDQPEPNIVYPLSQPLTIHVTPCPIIEFPCVPEHCSVDSRIPHAPENPTKRLNWNRFGMGFATSTANLTPADFAVQVVPANVIPGIASVTPSGNSADIVLDTRIAPEAWTCIRHIAGNRQCCWGSLPGDADGGLVVSDPDIFELLDNLGGNEVSRMSAEKCDIDRSNLCSPADLLFEVDLFNGAQAFQPYAGANLPACPPMRISP